MPCADTQLQAWLQVKWVTSGKQTRINSRKRRSTNLPFGWGQTKPQAYSVSQSVLTVTSTGQTYNWGLTTRDPVTGNGESWRFGYFEARIAFDPEPPPQSTGWPSFWGISVSKI